MTKSHLRLESYIPALRRYAWALVRNTDDADDLVQDCLERAIRRLDTYRSDGDLRSWLFSILHNVFISDRRRAARRPTVELEEVMELSVQGSQEGPGMVRELLAALDTLAEEQRVLILLVGVEDLSYREAARVVGVPVGTVMSRLSRGRENLRLALEGQLPEKLRLIK